LSNAVVTQFGLLSKAMKKNSVTYLTFSGLDKIGEGSIKPTQFETILTEDLNFNIELEDYARFL